MAMLEVHTYIRTRTYIVHASWPRERTNVIYERGNASNVAAAAAAAISVNYVEMDIKLPALLNQLDPSILQYITCIIICTDFVSR